MIFMIKISQFITHFCNTQNENHLFIAPKIFDTFTKLLYLLRRVLTISQKGGAKLCP